MVPFDPSILGLDDEGCSSVTEVLHVHQFSFVGEVPRVGANELHMLAAVYP